MNTDWFKFFAQIMLLKELLNLVKKGEYLTKLLNIRLVYDK